MNRSSIITNNQIIKALLLSIFIAEIQKHLSIPYFVTISIAKVDMNSKFRNFFYDYLRIRFISLFISSYISITTFSLLGSFCLWNFRQDI